MGSIVVPEVRSSGSSSPGGDSRFHAETHARSCARPQTDRAVPSLRAECKPLITLFVMRSVPGGAMTLLPVDDGARVRQLGARLVTLLASSGESRTAVGGEVRAANAAVRVSVGAKAGIWEFTSRTPRAPR
jgi:hypothetical protein